MYILGLSSYSHESSAALLRDGQLIALGEEERFNREKHTWKFPKNAIRYCLQEAGITLDQVDHITFFWQPWRELSGNISHVLKYFPASLQLLRAPSGGGIMGFRERVQAMMQVGNDLQREFNLARAPKVHFVEHHLAHAASTFYVSEFTEAAILTLDGRGESTSTMLSLGSGKDIKKLKEIKVPHSLGHFYAAITDYLGFKPFFDEWKVMGMSAYGKDTYVKDFEDLIHFLPSGEYRLNLEYFSFHTKGGSQWLSDKFIQKFGPRKVKKDDYNQHGADIALALQRVIEKAGVHLANHLYDLTKCEALCMTGGVALNCLMNKRILEQTKFKKFFIQPIANDAGTSLGSALYYYHQVLRGDRNFIFDRAYWGPSYTNEQIEPVLKAKNVKYRKCENISKDTAKEISEGKIVGWFQGRMECGPRALGNRSITVDPTRADMKDRLNARVKRREGFRPFAPSVIAERVDDFFVAPKGQPSPYMILIGDVKPGMESKIPAVTHNDGTARYHTVERHINQRYYDLISEFGKITGVPVLLNTSFNENEPIVCTPEEAVNCFLRTEFDVLAIGDFLVTK